MRPIFQFKPNDQDRAAFPGLPYGLRVRIVTPSGMTGTLPQVRVRTLSGQVFGPVSIQSLERL